MVEIIIIVLGALIGIIVAKKAKINTIDILIKEKDILNENIIKLTNLLNKEREKYQLILSNQKSEQVRMGLLSEKIAPFLNNFKYPTSDLCPLFKPIDYVCFSDDEIVFIEVKSGNSKLSKKQKRIKELIKNKKVRFEEYRVNE